MTRKEEEDESAGETSRCFAEGTVVVVRVEKESGGGVSGNGRVNRSAKKGDEKKRR